MLKIIYAMNGIWCTNEKLFNNWATSWENQFLPYANNKGADQPAHLHCLISAFVFAA